MTMTMEVFNTLNGLEKEAFLYSHPEFKEEINKPTTSEASKFPYINPKWLIPDSKDRMRADGLDSWKKARSMAGKITDPEKMVRRTKAVASRWGKDNARTEEFFKAMIVLGFSINQAHDALESA